MRRIFHYFSIDDLHIETEISKLEIGYFMRIEGRSVQAGSQRRERGFAPGAPPQDYLQPMLLEVFLKKSLKESYF